MSKIVWKGGATAVAQVDFVTPANVEIGDTFQVTAADDNGHSAAISFVASATTVQNVVEGLKAAALAASAAGTAPWDDITPTEDDTKLILTAATAGVPFYVTTATTDGGGNNTQTLVRSASVASAGPNDWNTAANWDGGAVPGAADEVMLDYLGAAYDVLYGLDQNAATLASLAIQHSYTGKVGQTGAYLQVHATKIDVGEHYANSTPTGATRVKIDAGTVESTITVHNASSSPYETYLPTVRLLAACATTALHVRRGQVGLACEKVSETSTVASVTISYVDSQDADAQVLLGPGVTLTTLMKTGGSCTLQSAATAVTNRAGTLTTAGSGAITTLNCYGGTVVSNSTGTITTLNAVGGTVDFSQSTVARTVTTLNVNGGKVVYDDGVVTVTNAIATTGTLEISSRAA